MSKKIVKHSKFQDFQDIYGYIPAGDINNHLIKSRMLQGLYRNEKIENYYCNYVHDNGFTNFMRHQRLNDDAIEQLSEIKFRNRLTDERRLFSNLLSSQPLAFNIFLPMRWDNYITATKIFQKLLPALDICQVTNVKMEYVPGDEQEQRVVNIDHSCFDVYVSYENTKNEQCGFGIEVKYTEPFSQSDFRKAEGIKRNRYTDAIKKYNGQFSEEFEDNYLGPKFNQLFRNQLLTQCVMDKMPHIKHCALVVAYSNADKKCINAIREFAGLLKVQNSYFPITIELIIENAIEKSDLIQGMSDLYSAIYDRYCNYSKLNKYFSTN